MVDKTKISKTMAYLLRHDSSGMKISEGGWANLESLLEKLQERWSEVNEEHVREVVNTDPKGRYEIRDDKIRARYGHSIDVDPDLENADKDVLYHGTTSEAFENILNEGLKSKGRQKVHLSTGIEEAKNVGKRRSSDPVILEVDVEGAVKEGIRIERASDEVYVSEDIPPKFISRVKK